MDISTNKNGTDDFLPMEVSVDLDSPFVDNRGEIQPIVDRSIQSIVIITSKKGTVRANHYHKTDWHYCFVQSGIIEYHHRPHGDDGPGEILVFKKGDLFFTPPMVDHAMVFLEETTFLTMGRNSRSQEVYEADVVRVNYVDPETVKV